MTPPATVILMAGLSSIPTDLSDQAKADGAHMNVQVHFGAVVSGEFGPPGLSRYDVIGKAVNVAARLGGRGVMLTAQAYRQLDHATRHQFDKHTPPISYYYRAPRAG